ncbi:MAG: hypothetical protein M5U34_40040 [Chloroflexi bacterium]|nr:hypothetical protein [Chloroflexota bacterium]
MPERKGDRMSAYLIPLALSFIGLILAFATYRNIRRGGARFYTLEREAMLRRAMLTWPAASPFSRLPLAISSTPTNQPRLPETLQARVEVVEEGEPVANPTPESLQLETFPPTPTLTATPDVNIPTATPTPLFAGRS